MSEHKKPLPALKRFGQNFLHDKSVLNSIADVAELSAEDVVLEIGMGNGALTEVLAQKAGKVISVEIDHKRFEEVAPRLRSRFPHLQCVEGDFLQLAPGLWKSFTRPVKLVANIPYNVTTPIIESCIEHCDILERAVLMVQKEVAERMQAGAGSSAYGSLSLYIQYHMDVSIEVQVPRTCFQPVPNVDSAVIKLIPKRTPPVHVLSEEKLFKVIRGAFWGKRKTLRNCLKKSPYTHYTNAMLERIENVAGIDLNRRGETLSLQEFAAMTNALEGKI